MNRKQVWAVVFMAVLGIDSPIKAQFHTIRDHRNECYEIFSKPLCDDKTVEIKTDTTDSTTDSEMLPASLQVNINPVKTEAKQPLRKKHLDYDKNYGAIPDLTLNKLLAEIRKCGIKHEKVVLAQAILETGWFTSPVCRNKNNLFGLTNPRTGQYYEFSHWTESVKAYYKLVQHRYKGGNYLLWLDEIGYAEAKTYVASLIRLMRQYFV